MHHFRQMICRAGPDCRSWRGISWQSLALHACGQTVLHTKVAKLWQGRTSLEIQCYFPMELELISTYCTDEAMSAWALQSQKHCVALRGSSAPGQDLAGLYKSAKCSYLTPCIQVIQVLSMPKILQHLVDPFTSCAPQDGHQCQCQNRVLQALEGCYTVHVRRDSVSVAQSFKISI